MSTVISAYYNKRLSCQQGEKKVINIYNSERKRERKKDTDTEPWWCKKGGKGKKTLVM